jgi:hypothetical protein
MREDEDHFRQSMPVLRRLIILVAVITAIPVAMWTITAVVRTYVGPPKLPTFRPMAAAPAAAGPNEAAAAAVAGAAGKAGKGEQQPVVEANATTSDAGGGSGVTADNATPDGIANAAPAAAAPPPAAPDTVRTASLPAANAPANGAPNPAGGVTQFAAEDQQPPATNWPAPPAANWPNPPAAQQPVEAVATASDAQPALGDDVPLPRKRPRTFAIAQARGIPLPRPRPDAAGPAAASEEQQPTPADWLRNLFGQQSQQPAAAAPSPDEYQAEPH